MRYDYRIGVIKPFIKEHNRIFTASVAVIFAFLWYAVLFGSASAAESTVVVDQNTTTWGFLAEGAGSNGTGEFVTGPATPPLGNGSAELRTNVNADGVAFGTQAFGGTRIADIEELSYRTFVQAGNDLVAPALQFNFDNDVTDADTSWKGRLVYEPYLNGSVVDGVWQTWNTAETDAVWWTTWSGASDCKMANPCTTAEVLSNWPNAGTNSGSLEGFLFKAGSGWSTPFVGNVDNLRVGLAGDVTVFDFELTPTLLSAVNGGGHILDQEGKRKNWKDISFGLDVSNYDIGTMGSATVRFHNTSNPDVSKTTFHAEQFTDFNYFEADSNTCESAVNFTAVGRWDGNEDYELIFRAGESDDTVRVTLKDDSGSVVYDSYGPGSSGDFENESSCVGTARTGLDKGNIKITKI